MKKMLFVAVLAIALALGMGGIAMANYGPHGGYLADTDACAGCHRAHVAFSDLTWSDGTNDHNALLVSEATTMKDFCYACHGNDKPGAATNVQGGKLDTAISGDTQAQTPEVNKVLNGGGFEFTGWGNSDGTTRAVGTAATITVDVSQKFATSQHDVDGSGSWGGPAVVGSIIWGSWGPGTDNGPGSTVDLTCTNCHDPHGSSNYRLLLDAVQDRAVGGYGGTFASAIDPDPKPWVISNEIGYPNDPTPVNKDWGWRLHKNTWTGMDGTPVSGEYMPDYTNAAYARPTNANSDGIGDLQAGTEMLDQSGYEKHGMSGWCTRACHDQYMVKVGTLENPGDSTTAPGDPENIANWGSAQSAGTYNPGDGSGARHRHRHPVNIPLTNWGSTATADLRGDRDLIIDPTLWMSAEYKAYDPTVKFVDLPLLHDPTSESKGSPYNTYDGLLADATQGNQVNALADGLDCLTCHRAHGSSATMTGYAGSGSNVNPSKTDGNLGTPPTYSSALLRADSRGVCERCHNK